MKNTLILLLILFLNGCDQANNEAKVNGRWYAQSQVDLGHTVFQKNCAECHGNKAQSILNWKQTLPDGSYPPPPLNGTAHAWHHPLSALSRVVNAGGIRLGGKMPAFKDKLTEEEKQAVIAYFQNFWNDEVYSAWLQRGGLN